MKKICSFIICTFLLISLVACSSGTNEPKIELTISAAASLNEALTDIKANYERKHNNIQLLINLGGSGALQQQIVQGAPTDIFISAARDPFKDLIKKGFIEKKNSSELLGNKLVLITNKSSKVDINGFDDLQGSQVKKIAIGTPEYVPAGLYAKQTLGKLGLWDKIQSKLILTKDVRQVLTYVETGNVDAGIVYLTDSKISDGIKVASKAKEQLHDPIIYPAGIVKSTKHPKEALKFLLYLKSKSAREVFEKYGFKALDR